MIISASSLVSKIFFKIYCKSSLVFLVIGGVIKKAFKIRIGLIDKYKRLENSSKFIYKKVNLEEVNYTYKNMTINFIKLSISFRSYF